MNYRTPSIGRSLTRTAAAIQLAIVAPVVLLVASLLPATAYAAGGFSFLPVGNTYKVGDALTVSIRENSGTDPTNAVRVEFTYPSNLLQYVSGDTLDSAFPISAIDQGGNGTVSYHRGSTVPVTGDQLVEKAVFKVIGSGTAVLSFTNSTVAISSKDNKTNVATAKANASYTLNPASVPAPTPTSGPTPAPSPSSAPSSGHTSTSTRSSTPVTRVIPVTSSGSTDDSVSIPLNDQSTIQLDAPVDIEPVTIQPDGISKVEYYLNGKLVKTVTVAPYTYRVQTSNLLNGKYTLTTKTYYTNGQTETTTQTLLVNNPFGWTQFRLWVQKYLLLIMLLIFLVVGAIVALIIRRNMSGGSGMSGYEELANDYISSPPSTMVTPTSPPTPPTV